VDCSLQYTGSTQPVTCGVVALKSVNAYTNERRRSSSCVNGGLLTSAGPTTQRADRLWWWGSVAAWQRVVALIRGGLSFKVSKSELAGRGRLLVARRAATTATMTATVTAATHPVCVSRCLSNFLKRDREAECAADDRCCVKWCALCLTWTSSPLASRRKQVRR